MLINGTRLRPPQMHRAEFVVKHRGGHANGIFSGKPGGTTRRLAPDVHSTRFESARTEKGVGEPESAPALHASAQWLL